jgi:hypothetical protein
MESRFRSLQVLLRTADVKMLAGLIAQHPPLSTFLRRVGILLFVGKGGIRALLHVVWVSWKKKEEHNAQRASY